MRRRPEAIRAEQLIDEGDVAWSPCRATRPASTTSSSPVSRPIAITSVIGIAGDAQQAAIRSCPTCSIRCSTTRCEPKRVGTAAVSLAWQLDDRGAPDTVPMKVVPHQCGALGRSRPALPAQFGGAVGSYSPSVPMRRMPHAGRLVQPLRSRQSVLQSGLLASEARLRAARSRLSLPALGRRTRAACRAFTALARTHRAAGRSARHGRCCGRRWPWRRI